MQSPRALGEYPRQDKLGRRSSPQGWGSAQRTAEKCAASPGHTGLQLLGKQEAALCSAGGHSQSAANGVAMQWEQKLSVGRWSSEYWLPCGGGMGKLSLGQAKTVSVQETTCSGCMAGVGLQQTPHARSSQQQQSLFLLQSPPHPPPRKRRHILCKGILSIMAEHIWKGKFGAEWQ